MASAIATLANDGIMFRPHIVNYVENIITHDRQLVETEPVRTLDLKPEHIAEIKRALIAVNKEGTGARAFAGAEYESAGKTGTAQVVGIKQGEKYVENRIQERHRDHALFIAYAPADKPKIALALVVENSGFGARAAAPIARQVFDFYLLGKERATPAKEDDIATGN
jgi:penicillin-binding protein 2